MSNLPAATALPRLLIVDDERLNIKILNELLRNDYEIMVATGGEQALKLAASATPDLILLDIMMPELDGHEVCHRLKEQQETKCIPIIFITAMNDAADETRGFELGAVDYVTKPFNPAVVKARVQTHIRLKLQADLLEKLASLDGLTGIPNRRAFDETREREWGRSQRAGNDFSILMIDVDMFKQYNDHYGHGAGDDCLTRVARALTACLQRPGDFVARYGGEEFAAVLPNCADGGALLIGERFCAAVAALRIPHSTSTAAPHVTISIGVATGSPTANSNPAEFCEAADKMLYAAKENGRNQVKFIRLPQQGIAQLATPDAMGT
jgi:diguanylate cyclase (GGDEF)-like protein